MPRLDDPICLRPFREPGPTPGSIFDDPGDDKSWHATQRSESLERFYEGREASWYASAVAPLRGAKRVLDIGCGPGLALAQLLEEGAEEALGVDRWPGFVPRAEAAGVRMALHDLTLPMPFIPTGAYHGILSHYVLNYMSPIGVRQVLRECERILSDEGRLLLYLGAIGLGSGDDSQTVPYQGPVVEALLEEAGFVDVQVEMSPNGRNTVARARPAAARPERNGAAAAEFDGEIQLTAACGEANGDSLGISLSGGDHSLDFRLGCGPEGGRLSVCARVVESRGAGAELHLWAWRGDRVVASEALRLSFRPSSIQFDLAGQIEFVDAWSPRPLPLERRASAYLTVGKLAPGEDLSEAERGVEGRILVVEGEPPHPEEAQRRIGPGRNRFLIRRCGSSPDLVSLDADFVAGRAAGVVIDRATVDGDRWPELPLWAASRRALVVIEGHDWDEIAATFGAAEPFLGSAPILIASPALAGSAAAAPPDRVVSSVAAGDGRFLVLPAEAPAPPGLLGRVLRGGDPAVEDVEAAEALRHLTERALLITMRLRADRPREQVGRGEAL